MKKKGIFFAAALCLAAVLLCACSPAHTDYSQYVKLGEYKGLEVKKIEVQTVTDEELLETIKYMHDHKMYKNFLFLMEACYWFHVHQSS